MNLRNKESLTIKLNDINNNELNKDETILLLGAHHQDMLLHSPIESVHALDLSELKLKNIRFWTAWIDNELAGCGALKFLNDDNAEIKSMRTSSFYLRKGVAAKLLEHILNYAKFKNVQQVSLETGTMDVFKPAHKLYLSFGFEECEPFADYVEDPYSLFMTKTLNK